MSYLVDEAFKAQAWELAKGYLRAAVQVRGSYENEGSHSESYQRFTRLSDRVEKFIEELSEEFI